MNLPAVHFGFPLALLAAPALVGWAWWLARTSRAYLPPERRAAALVIRLLVSLLLPLALAQPVLVWPAPGVDVVFLVDRSASLGPAGAAASESWLGQALEAKRDDDRAAFVTFGSAASVEQPLSRSPLVPRLPSEADQANHTDISAAIRTGLSLLGPEAARRIVLLSDGQENLGSAGEAARLAAAAGVPVDVVPLGQPAEREVSAIQLDTPPTLREGERFSAVLYVRSTLSTPARLLVTTEGRLIASQEVSLRPGVNRFVVPVEPLEQGTHVFRAEVEADDDTFPANNHAGSVSVVNGPPSVLLVEGSPGGASFLRDALAVAGVEAELTSPQSTVWDSAALRRFQAVVLVDVPADALPEGHQQTLDDYVQSFGGGLVVVGGEQSYGPGGYTRTTLESMLPVRMDLRGRTLSTSVAMVLVMDASGSMGGGPEGSSKMDLAKEAAISAAELLGEFDRIGVVAFEDSARWAVQFQPVEDMTIIQQEIADIQPGGGTDAYPGLVMAHEALSQIDAKVKHVILLTDGQTPQRDWQALTDRFRADGITLSTIAIGTDADYILLQQLAESGEGRYYEGNDPFDLPRLVVKETIQVQRAAVVEEEFRPVRLLNSPVTEGLDFQAAPPLRGYIATSPKPGTNVLLVSRQLDPILAEWQYGLGRVLTWTSDARNHWAALWLDGWPEFSRFWSQVVRRAARPPDDPNRSLLIGIQDTDGVIRLEAQSDERELLNFLPTRATVSAPDGSTQEVALAQIAPGTYQGAFPLEDEGAYLVQATQEEGEGNLATQSGGVVLPYSAEFRALGLNHALLEDVARRTGGSVLREPGAAFAPLHTDSPLRQSRQVWPWLAGLAGLLFLLDVGVRRLRLEQMAHSRVWRRMQRLLAIPESSTWRPAAARPARMSAASLGSMVGGGQHTGGPAPGGPSTEAPVSSAGRLLAAKRRAAAGRQAGHPSA